MNPKKQLYLDVRARIEEKCPLLGQHVRMYYDQFQRLDDQEQIVFPFPCVFIDIIGDIVWTQLGSGAQIANNPLAIRCYIGSNFYNGEDQEENLEIFDLQDELQAALQYYSTGNFNNLIRSAERREPQYSSVYVWSVDYLTTLTDTSKDRPAQDKETTGEVTPVINVELKNTW